MRKPDKSDNWFVEIERWILFLTAETGIVVFSPIIVLVLGLASVVRWGMDVFKQFRANDKVETPVKDIPNTKFTDNTPEDFKIVKDTQPEVPTLASKMDNK